MITNTVIGKICVCGGGKVRERERKEYKLYAVCMIVHINKTINR